MYKGQKVELRLRGKWLAAEGSRLYIEHRARSQAIFTIFSLGDDLVEIKANDGKWIGMDSSGNAYTTTQQGQDTRFAR